jgi:hypothetical protein
MLSRAGALFLAYPNEFRAFVAWFVHLINDLHRVNHRPVVAADQWDIAKRDRRASMASGRWMVVGIAVAHPRAWSPVSRN